MSYLNKYNKYYYKNIYKSYIIEKNNIKIIITTDNYNEINNIKNLEDLENKIKKGSIKYIKYTKYINNTIKLIDYNISISYPVNIYHIKLRDKHLLIFVKDETHFKY